MLCPTNGPTRENARIALMKQCHGLGETRHTSTIFFIATLRFDCTYVYRVVARSSPPYPHRTEMGPTAL